MLFTLKNVVCLIFSQNKKEHIFLTINQFRAKKAKFKAVDENEL